MCYTKLREAQEIVIARKFPSLTSDITTATEEMARCSKLNFPNWTKRGSSFSTTPVGGPLQHHHLQNSSSGDSWNQISNNPFSSQVRYTTDLCRTVYRRSVSPLLQIMVVSRRTPAVKIRISCHQACCWCLSVQFRFVTDLPSVPCAEHNSKRDVNDEILHLPGLKSVIALQKKRRFPPK